LVAPESGALASGRDGSGRLADPEQIAEACVAMLTPDTLKGKKVVVSAGPTREHSDPVRFLSNPSSGKMGFALAEQAVSRGAQVTLVAGPVALEAPHGVTRIDVTGTEEMLEAMRQCTAGADLVVMAAAPADYRPAQPSAHKVKKGDGDLTLTLTRTPDILKSLDLRARGTLVIGFAAETRDLEAYARKKLQDKNLDAVVGNIVGHAGTGFGAQNNAGRLFFRDGGELELPLGTKGEMAARILDWAQERL
ncbi:MAG: bifunctional phosphopantothenoylcysteine decarboxylase/phosphopantothenate--cysteine ligase CoaBC, partial [Myxococcota bacterium]